MDLGVRTDARNRCWVELEVSRRKSTYKYGAVQLRMGRSINRSR